MLSGGTEDQARSDCAQEGAGVSKISASALLRAVAALLVLYLYRALNGW